MAAIIHTLRIEIWNPVLTHKKETREVNEKHGTKGVARVLTHVCKHPLIEELTKLRSAVYAYNDAHTLPTISEGTRLVPAATELEHAKKLSEFKCQFEKLVGDFMPIYPNIKAQAPVFLNGLYDPSMWPDESAVRRRFVFSSNYGMESWTAASYELAKEDLRDRLRDALKRVAERCASDGKLYQSVFDNLAAVIAMVPDITDDTDMVGIAKQAKALADQDKNAVVKCEAQRKATASEAERLAAFFGK
jgi:hypothetical protein